MALPSTYRWIMVGSLLIRADKRARVQTTLPSFTLEDVMEAGKTRICDKDQYREYESKSRIMWCSQFGENEDCHHFLVHVGNKNSSGIAFVNFNTRESRDIEKEDHEGDHYTSHILIKKTPDEFGKYLILIEKVPGIHTSSLKNHFGWICRDSRFMKTYTDEHGKQNNSHPIFEIDGYQSNTIGDALKNGRLQDIEFIRHAKDFKDGLDEEPIIKEVSHRAIWNVGKHVDEEQARSIFSRIPGFRQKFASEDEKIDMYVRIKTDAGVKQTEVKGDADAILEQAFIQHEIIRDFETPLKPRYQKPRQDILKKMITITANLSS